MTLEDLLRRNPERLVWLKIVSVGTNAVRVTISTYPASEELDFTVQGNNLTPKTYEAFHSAP
jgi:hypothetical protein